MVRLFFSKTTESSELYEKFSPERREKIFRLQAPAARGERLAAELLLAEILPRYGADVTDIYYGEYGKPLLKGLCLSVSHSGGAAVLALSSLPVGCDMERLRTAPLPVANKKFTARERAYLEGSGERDLDFFKLWTAKESYLKLTGEGLRALPLVEFDAERGRILRDGSVQSCFVRHYVHEDYLIAVCAEEADIEDKITTEIF